MCQPTLDRLSDLDVLLQRHIGRVSGEHVENPELVEAGPELAEYRLDAMPDWDGMAAAGGHLLVSLADGAVRCFGPRED